MSWEEMGTRSIPCPCGKGKIIRTDYMDDWNRSEEEYSIDCPECKAKYKFVSRSYYKHAGDSGTVHYLLDVNYPAYNGPCLTDVFPRVVNIYQMPFEEYLIPLIHKALTIKPVVVPTIIFAIVLATEALLVSSSTLWLWASING